MKWKERRESGGERIERKKRRKKNEETKAEIKKKYSRDWVEKKDMKADQRGNK